MPIGQVVDLDLLLDWEHDSFQGPIFTQTNEWSQDWAKQWALLCWVTTYYYQQVLAISIENFILDENESVVTAQNFRSIETFLTFIWLSN